MRRRDDNEQHEEWLPWLKRVLRFHGYEIDTPKGGGIAQIAKDTGLAQSTISRLLQGVAPHYDTALVLSRTLGIPLQDLLIRTGRATEEDFPQSGVASEHPGVVSGKPLTPEQVAIAAGVDEGDRDWFVTMIKRMRRDESGSDGTRGGAVAEG